MMDCASLESRSSYFQEVKHCFRSANTDALIPSGVLFSITVSQKLIEKHELTLELLLGENEKYCKKSTLIIQESYEGTASTYIQHKAFSGTYTSACAAI